MGPGIDPDHPAAMTLKHAFVSCWNMSEYENASLWQVYGRGIAIRSTFARLRESLICTDPVYIGVVNYIDYRRDSFPEGNAFTPLLHKRLYFENERELRAVIPGQTMTEVKDPDGEVIDWSWTGDPRVGVAATVDLDKLIAGIYVAPGETLLFEAVEAICRRYELGLTPQQSSLDELPRF